MEQYDVNILGSKGYHIREDEEYEAVYKTESGKIMENRPFISVVMPVYNAEKYLVSSIESVLNQSFHDLELILVNDCSTDGSSAICKDYLCRDARVKYIELTKNVGAGNTRNAGVETARGVYLAFIDADDTIELDLYQKAVDASCDGSLDLIVWGATECYYGKNGCLSSKNAIQGTPCVLNEDSQIARMALELEQKTLLGYQWNKLYKREIVENEHIRFEKSVLYEDFFFSLSVLNHVNSMAVIESAGYYYNKRFEGSITNKYVLEYFELSRRRVNSMYCFCKKREIGGEASNVLGNIYLRYILSGLMRNEDKRSGMSSKDKIQWIKKICNDKLYIRTAKNCKTHSKILGILQKFMNGKKYGLCRLMGIGTYLVKVYFKNLYVSMTKQGGN